jgi:hypothetical protein
VRGVAFELKQHAALSFLLHRRLPFVCLLHNARGTLHLFRRRWSTAANNFIPGQVQFAPRAKYTN